MPIGGDAACVIWTIVNDPAALAVCGLVIFIAFSVRAYSFALAPAVDRRANGCAVPPSENFTEYSHGFAIRTKQGAAQSLFGLIARSI